MHTTHMLVSTEVIIDGPILDAVTVFISPHF